MLDASMAMAWHFKDEETGGTAAVEHMTLDHAVVVPRHWFAEVANAMLIGERKGRTTVPDCARFIDRIADLMLVIDDLGGLDLASRLLPLARAHGLTVYDALYLELAERRGLPLASLDDDLCAAAFRIGVPLITEVP